jgi:hypothetical protein
MSENRQENPIPRKNLGETLSSIEFYILKSVLVVLTAIGAIAIIAYAVYHLYHFLKTLGIF